MTILEAFTAGHLPEFGTFCLPLADNAGQHVGIYIDPQAYAGVWTIQ